MGLFDKVLAGASTGAETSSLSAEWTKDRTVVLKGTPESLDEVKAAVDLTDPGSVCAYWLYSVMAMTADYDIGMGMMKYLYADIEPFGRGFTEGGASGKAGWDSFFNDRLKDDDYRWLPRTYFAGAVAANGFKPETPLCVELHYNEPNTTTINSQSLESLGRLNIVYTVKSNAAGNQVNITVSKFEGSDRWYVTSGSSSAGIFYDQRSALTAEAKEKLYS